ncbi:MAG: hypothetical protein EOP46_21165 [Sphingobacteriaceae bacterium]|nr:MAG: hypothetical protein EOP46_21165 [Sphingobacteriaceae bacterium]
MKKFTLLLLFFSLAVMAQESFPYKRPILMLNKTVTVVKLYSSEKDGYRDFYSDVKRTTHYKAGNEVRTPSDELFGKEFKVVSIDSTLSYNKKYYEYMFGLQGTETFYYAYSPRIPPEIYPFEVKGGLDLPEGFYCDFVEKSKYDYTAHITEIWLRQSYDYGTTKNQTSATFTFFDKFALTGIKSMTLLLENNKTIEQKINETYGSPQSKEFKYNFTIMLEDKDIELLKANKLIGVKLKDKVHTFHPGTGVSLSGILKCLGTLPLIPKH